MEQFIVKRTTIDQIQLPSVLYKYRQADNDFHINILKTGKVYYSPPSGFEDKLDCKIPVRYDLLTDEEIIRKYYNELKIQDPWAGHFLLLERAQKWADLGNFRNPDLIAEAESEYWDELNRRFGVLSLTEDNSNPAMWEKYADSLNGFCIGFTGRTMLEEIGGGGGDVTYVDELPVIKPFMDPLYQNQLQAFSKEKKWSFEKEYRSHKTWFVDVDNNTRNMKVPNEAFVELIIGTKVDGKRKNELIEYAKALNPEINVLSARLENDVIIIE
ncbi:MAG: DUF2971 domain-containing protein [Bacteroidetes bacterium]|nr:DUF2971 domain-containing protein [Bacteroidota bacterium]